MFGETKMGLICIYAFIQISRKVLGYNQILPRIAFIEHTPWGRVV